MNRWAVFFHPDFYEEFESFSHEIQDDILAKSLLLEKFGPHLGRPHVDTLNGSRFFNMKELRLDVGQGAWRIAFAFDPKRTAILLVAGNKTGKNQRSFYHALIRKADQRFKMHLIYLNENRK